MDGLSNGIADILFPISRWVHMVCTTLIVGGTLFFELVLPIAIEDLKREQQLYVMARARLVFRWVVWISVGGLLLSGGVGAWRLLDLYGGDGYVSRWAMAHVGLGVVGMVVALVLTTGSRPPEHPVRWMRLNLVILLVAIFLGSATRHFQLALREKSLREPKAPPAPVQRDREGDPSTAPTTGPATMPSTTPTTLPATRAAQTGG